MPHSPSSPLCTQGGTGGAGSPGFVVPQNPSLPSLTHVTAQDGIFYRKSGMLTLNRNILVTTPTYQLRLNEAVVDTGSGNIVSDKPVEVTLEQGTVTSKRFEVMLGGEVIRFEGDVVMKLNFGEPDAKAAKP